MDKHPCAVGKNKFITKYKMNQKLYLLYLYVHRKETCKECKHVHETDAVWKIDECLIIGIHDVGGTCSACIKYEFTSKQLASQPLLEVLETIRDNTGTLNIPISWIKTVLNKYIVFETSIDSEFFNGGFDRYLFSSKEKMIKFIKKHHLILGI